MEQNYNVRRQSDEFITITDLWHICLSHWTWFATSLLLFLCIAGYYLAVTPNLYTREASVLIKQESAGKNAGKQSDNNDFNDLGLVTQPPTWPTCSANSPRSMCFLKWHAA